MADGTAESLSLPKEDLNDWRRRWEEGKTAWHKATVDPVLEKRIGLIEDGCSGGLSILVPMCGRSLDLLWLCSRGHSVTGVEISSIAVGQLFTDNSIPFTSIESGPFTIYKATDRDLNVLCGDVFNLDTSYAGPFDVIWDCNAIVAINADERERYVKAELSVLKECGRILMTTWVYEQSIHLRFPLCVSPEMVEKLFAAQCDVRVVENIDLPNDSPFCQRHELPWAIRPVLFLNRKELVQ